MDKQKKIEEMANDLTEFFDKTPMELSFNHDNGEVDVIKEEKALKVLDDIIRQALIPVFAECLTDLCYRKIPENAVVLTREEYERLGLVVETVQEYETKNGEMKLVKERKTVKKDERAFVDLLNRETRELQISQRVRKETVEKFAERLKEQFADSARLCEQIDEIANAVKGVQNGN